MDTPDALARLRCTAALLRTIGMRLAVDRLEQELARVADHPACGAPVRRSLRRRNP